MPVCGSGTRRELMADLTAALAPGSPERLFAVVRLHGFGAVIRRGGEAAATTLLAEAERSLLDGVDESGRCYQPRFDEWCILFDSDVETAIRHLDAVTAAIDEVGETCGIFSEAGVAILPQEARDPLGALERADRRVAPAGPEGGRELGRTLRRARRGDGDHANVVELFPNGPPAVVHG